MAALVLQHIEEISDRSATPLLVGRQSELSEIQALIDDARRGEGGAIVVHGERGVGKSAVLEASAR
jgi:predicted ATPase